MSPSLKKAMAHAEKVEMVELLWQTVDRFKRIKDVSMLEWTCFLSQRLTRGLHSTGGTINLRSHHSPRPHECTGEKGSNITKKLSDGSSL